MTAVGIIAGGGMLPQTLADHCRTENIPYFIVGLKGQVVPAWLSDHPHKIFRIGAAGAILKALRKHQAHDLVMIGKIRRPSLAELRPDAWGMRFFSSVALKGLGDDGLLSALKKALQSEGFQIRGIQEYLPGLLFPPGELTKKSPSEQDKADIARGVEVAEILGKADVGQSVIVQQDIVLGVEAIEGTDALVKRCSELKRDGKSGGVLVKLCKPEQDTTLDLPTIGTKTVEAVAAAGFSGIAVEAQKALFAEAEETIVLANKKGIFLTGI